MESISSIERRVGPGKTVSPRSVQETFLRNGGYFKKCKAGSLFTIKGNPQLDKENFVFSDKSEYPYFTRTVFNNGIYGYVDYLDESHLIKGNSIAVGMMGMQFFYMSHDFYAGQFTKTAFPKFNGFNSRIALWFIAWFNKSSKKFLSVLVREFEKVFSDTEIIVPYYANGDLALDYMESRIREMEESRIREMDAYLNVTGFQNCELTEEEQDALEHINNKRIKEFTISDLYYKVELAKKPFDKRKDSRQIPDSKYCIPLVNAKHGDNGIMYYGDKAIFESMDMTIDIVQNGAIATGDVYPQPHPTGVLWDAYLIRALHHQDPAETLMYMSAAIRKSIKRKYTYDNKAYWEHVKKEIINLPVTTSGDIDYHFMETYIRAIEKQIIQRVKDWRAKEISPTKDIVNSDMDNKLAVANNYKSHTYELKGERDTPMMVAEDILIYGSLEVRLRNTKQSELLAGSLDLMLMYAISPAAREKTEKAGHIALGIKEANLSEEAVKAYLSVRYIMFHYWKNSEAKPFALTAPTRLVSRADVPEGFLLRQEKEAKQYLLLEYNPATPASIGELDILKAQRKGCNRYMPFVCRVENIIDSISH